MVEMMNKKTEFSLLFAAVSKLWALFLAKNDLHLMTLDDPLQMIH